MSTRLMTLAVLLSVTTLGHAAIPGEVIAVYDGSVGKFGLMPASTGGKLQYIPCGSHDMTHNGSPRYLLATVPGGSVLPDTYANTRIVASDEDCVQTVLLFESPVMRFSTVRWSHDGQRVAAFGTTWDFGSGEIVERGIYVGDVVRDGTGRPVALANLQLLINGPIGETLAWSGDDQRIAYTAGAPGTSGGMQWDIWLYDIATGLSTNVTNSPNYSEDQPTCSPVAERIAFQRLVTVKGMTYYDIYTISASGGPVTQVTTKATSGAPQNQAPTWSPDGQYLLFVGGNTGWPWREFDLFRIKADGTGKATNLTGRQDGNFRLNMWRR